MAADDIDALVCRLPENVVMLSGHWPLNGWSFLLFPRDGHSLLVVPDCDALEARNEMWEGDCAPFTFGVLAAGDPYADIARALKQAAVGRGWKRIGIEAGFESVAPPWNAAEPAVPAAITRLLLESVYGAEALVDATGLLMRLRARKTRGELDKLRRVNAISTFGLQAFAETVAVGVSGLELVAAVERAIVCEGTGYEGADRVRAFAQVSTGPLATARAFRPMVVTTRTPMRPGDMALLELAVVADGFWCDRTRVRVAGAPSAAQEAAFNAVLSAQQAAIAMVKPGARAGAVDQAAREIIHSHGYTDAEFLHVTGHGLGFRYHEPVPLLCPGGDTVLEEGMVHTVEPGVYHAAFGGIRLEDDVIVTAQGAEVMGRAEVRMCE